MLVLRAPGLPGRVSSLGRGGPFSGVIRVSSGRAAVARRGWHPPPASLNASRISLNPVRPVAHAQMTPTKDDRTLREPAKNLRHAPTRPVCDPFVTAPPIDGEAFGRGLFTHEASQTQVPLLSCNRASGLTVRACTLKPVA